MASSNDLNKELRERKSEVDDLVHERARLEERLSRMELEKNVEAEIF